MSASREKKARQGLSADYLSPQKEKERKEQASARRTTVIFTICAALFLLFAAFMLVWNSNIIQRGATALRVNGEDYTAGELAYYYYSSRSTTLNSNSSIDSSKSLREQLYTDGVQTWYDQVLADAVSGLSKTVSLSQAAKAAGFDDKGEVEETVSTTMAALANAASQNGYSVSQYLKAVYGPMMTRSTFEKCLRADALAGAYAATLGDVAAYSDTELNAAYDADPKSYELAYYESALFFSGNYMSDDAESSGTDNAATGENSETSDTAAEDVKASAALAASQEDAAAALRRIQAGESVEAVAEELNANYTNSCRYYSTEEFVVWLFDDARREGDATVVDYYGSGSMVVVFRGKERADFHNVDVRHILVDDEETAKSLLEQFNAGDKSEASFAQLATANTKDTGSAESGGLYTDVRVGQMVKPFEEWCFDASRKAGDTGIVKTDYGFHVMYYVGQSEYPCWQEMAAITLGNEKANALTHGIDVEHVSGGLKYIDPIR